MRLHTGCQLKHGQSGTAINVANPKPPIIPNVVYGNHSFTKAYDTLIIATITSKI